MSSASPCRVFHRDLPGGGFVAIDVVSSRSLLGRRRFDGSVIVERRKGRVGRGSAPVIARACERSMEAVIQQLLPAALSNAAIGAALLRRARPSVKALESRTKLQRFPYGRDVSGIASS